MLGKWRNTLKQAEFCVELMTRVYVGIYGAKPMEHHPSMYNYTQMQADIIRLRRELNTLRKMLNPWEAQG